MEKSLRVSIKDEKGFSLIESFVVLSIILLFSHLSIVSFHYIYDEVEKNLFFKQLQTDLYNARATAINRETFATVTFLRGESSAYKISIYQHPNANITRELPKSIKLLKSNLMQFTFSGQGTISQFGTVQFEHQGETIKLVFTIGQGRFTINE